MRKLSHNLYNILVQTCINKSYSHNNVPILTRQHNNKNYSTPRCCSNQTVALFISVVIMRNLLSKKCPNTLPECSNINKLKFYNLQLKY